MKNKVKDFLADLITDERWSVCALERLLTSPAATWHAVSRLCAGNEDALELYQTLAEGTEIMATWLPHPASQQEDVCLVLFYQDDDMTSSVAVLNRARHLELLRERGICHQHGPAAAS
jgi:hypothetical protein